MKHFKPTELAIVISSLFGAQALLAQQAALVQQIRSGRSMDGAVHAAPAEERRIRGVYYRVY